MVSPARAPRFELRRGDLVGRGAPVALLHGFLGRPASWDAVVDALPRRGPLALGELPGHGPDPIVAEGATFDEVADALVDALPFVDPTWLVGYSMGGRLALAMALRRPDRVRGAVLVGASPGLPSPADRAARASWDDDQAARIEREGLARFVTSWEALPLFASQGALPEETLARQRAHRLDHVPAALAWSLRTLGLGRMPPLWSELASARTEIVIVAGSLDAKFSAHARAVARTTEHARAVLAAQVGHNVGLEAPSALARIVDGAIAPTTTR